MALGAYGFYVIGSYLMVAAVAAALVGWVMVDHRRQEARLRDLESRGVQRRSSERP